MRVLLLFIFCTACVGPFKKPGDSDTFVKDSDFLKQGNTIEAIDPVIEKKEELKKPKLSSQDQKKEVTTESETKNKKTVSSSKKTPTQKNNTNAKSLNKNQDGSVAKKKKTSKPTIIKSSELEKQSKKIFFPGEKVILSATYFGVEAGKITLGVDSMKKFNGKKVFHFYAFGRTSSVFSLFYGVKDKVESLWSPEIQKPLSLAFDVEETKQKYKTRTYFYWKKNKAEYIEEGWERGKGKYQGKKDWNLPNNAQDIVSAIFYIRTLPLKVGDSFTFNVLENEKVIQTTIKVDRKEVLGTREGDFDTLVLKPSFKTEGKFKKVGDISIWVTNDDFKQVIRVESKIKIGTVVAKLFKIHRP